MIPLQRYLGIQILFFCGCGWGDRCSSNLSDREENGQGEEKQQKPVKKWSPKLLTKHGYGRKHSPSLISNGFVLGGPGENWERRDENFSRGLGNGLLSIALATQPHPEGITRGLHVMIKDEGNCTQVSVAAVI